MPTDLPSAARRVAEATAGHYDPDPKDLRAILPVLEAVAAGPGADRVELYARAIRDERKRLKDAARCGMCDPRDCGCEARALARAAIALADAERAADRRPRIRVIERQPIVISDE